MNDGVKSALRILLNIMPARFVCRLEFERQSFHGFNERAVEYEFVFRQVARLYPLRVLDVGTGTTALPHLIRNCGCLVTATDNIKGFWPSGMSNRHYHILHDDITDSAITDRFDLITCISVLEHIRDHEAAVRNMFRLLNPNGHIVMTFPYSETSYVRNVYELPASNAFDRQLPYITQSYSRAELSRWCRVNGGKVAEQEYWQFWTGDHWTLGDQVIPPLRVTSEDKHQLTCLMIQRV